LLRGNLPIGDRETIAANISEPYVVEGFSHRFGNGHLSELSYALVPEGDRAVSPPYKGECLCSEILDLAFRYCTKPIAEELQARNAAFDRGMRTVLPEIQITRPSNSSITSVVKLPDQMEIGSTHFAEEARINGVGVFPMSHFYPDGVQPPKVAERYFRVAVGEMDIERVEVGADYLARGMSLRMRD